MVFWIRSVCAVQSSFREILISLLIIAHSRTPPTSDFVRKSHEQPARPCIFWQVYPDDCTATIRNNFLCEKYELPHNHEHYW